MRIARTLILSASALSITACANITGAPRSVVPPDQLQQLVTSNRYSVESALANFYNSDARRRQGLNQQDYRNMVSGLYLAAADANYQEFRAALGSSSRGSALGFDTLSLLLTGLAASSGGNRAEDLATAATALTGFRTSFDRNLLFDRTIPAIIASMDAERARTRAGIVERLRLDSTAYPLPQFFADLQTYELSATLERAISRVNETANEDRAEANDELRTVLAGCDLPEDISTQLRAFRNVVLLPNDPQRTHANLTRVAQEIGLALPAQAERADSVYFLAAWRSIYDHMQQNQCRRGARAAEIARLTAILTAPAPGGQ